MELTHIDLFSGIGGFTLACQWVGIRTEVFCEKDERCRRFLERTYPGVPIIPDIREFDGTRWRGRFLLTAGVPCQPASRAGKQRGKDDDRWLWPEALRVVSEARPDWCLFENPLGINDVGLDGILTDLESLDYEVAPPLIIPACAVNSPQLRNRYWLVCHNKDRGGIGGSYRQKELRKIGQIPMAYQQTGICADKCSTEEAHDAPSCDRQKGGVRGRPYQQEQTRQQRIQSPISDSLRELSEQKHGRERICLATEGANEMEIGNCDKRGAKTFRDVPDQKGGDSSLSDGTNGMSGEISPDDSPQLRNRYWIVAHSSQIERTRPREECVNIPRKASQSDVADTEDNGYERTRETWGRREGFKNDTTGNQAESDRQWNASLDGRRNPRRDTPASFWSNSVWLPCADGKVRRAPDDSFGLVDGLHRSVLGALGNSIVPQLAYEIIRAIVESSHEEM